MFLRIVPLRKIKSVEEHYVWRVRYNNGRNSQSTKKDRSKYRSLVDEDISRTMKKEICDNKLTQHEDIVGHQDEDDRAGTLNGKIV